MKLGRKVSIAGGFVAAGILVCLGVPFNRDCIISLLVGIIYGVAIGICTEAEDH